MVLADTYRIDQVLGAGGFGITYLAEDTKLGLAVAIKEYFPAEFALRDASRSVRSRSGEHGDTFRWGLESFIKEAQMLARFDHPSVGHVMRVIEANNTAYMIQRYEDGMTLAHHLDGLGRPMSEEEIHRLFDPLLDGLEVVHAQSVLHRDISPDNIIVRPNGTGVLIDFGAARRAIADRSQMLTGIVREGYSPPEQYASGGARQGPWTDVYALGAVLYRIVTGAKPATSIHRMIEDVLVPASTAAAERYSAVLLAAIDQAMRLKQADRPQNVAALRLALGAADGQAGDPTMGRARAQVRTESDVQTQGLAPGMVREPALRAAAIERVPLPPGSELAGQFRIGEVLGAGVVGITYLAEDLGLLSPVVIREYVPAGVCGRAESGTVEPASPEHQALYRAGLQSFITEAKLLANIDLPSLTRVQRLIEANGTAYMVVRREAGTTLKAHLQTLGRLPSDTEVRRILYPLMEAIEALHGEGQLHGDIRPDNILIRPDGRSVLMEPAGTAPLFAGLRDPSGPVSFDCFSAPEFRSDNAKMRGPWSDVFALGGVLYQSVTGDRPQETVDRLLDDRLRPARDAAKGGFAAGLLTAIDESLQLRPVERPQDVAAFRRLLGGAAAPQRPTRSAPVSAPRTGPTQLPSNPRGGFDALATGAAPASALGLIAQQGAATQVPGAPSVPPAAAAPGWMPLHKLLFSYSGRINRAKIWLGVLLMFFGVTIAVLAVIVLGLAAGEEFSEHRPPGPITSIGLFVVFAMSIYSYGALAVKRCHDRGRSGWFALVLLVPLLSLWPLIELYFLSGETGANKWGVNPLNPGAAAAPASGR